MSEWRLQRWLYAYAYTPYAHTHICKVKLFFPSKFISHTRTADTKNSHLHVEKRRKIQQQQHQRNDDSRSFAWKKYRPSICILYVYVCPGTEQRWACVRRASSSSSFMLFVRLSLYFPCNTQRVVFGSKEYCGTIAAAASKTPKESVLRNCTELCVVLKWSKMEIENEWCDVVCECVWEWGVWFVLLGGVIVKRTLYSRIWQKS